MKTASSTIGTAAPDHTLARCRAWFYAAALYNLVWGSVNVILPELFLLLAEPKRPEIAAQLPIQACHSPSSASSPLP